MEMGHELPPSYLMDTGHPLQLSLGPYLEMSIRDLDFVTHLLEEPHPSLVQQHTDEHPSLVGCL